MRSLEANPFIASNQNIWQTNTPHSASVFVIALVFFLFAIRFVLFTELPVLNCVFMPKTQLRNHVYGIKSVTKRPKKSTWRKMHWHSLKVSHPFDRLLRCNWMFYIWWRTQSPCIGCAFQILTKIAGISTTLFADEKYRQLSMRFFWVIAISFWYEVLNTIMDLTSITEKIKSKENHHRIK